MFRSERKDSKSRLFGHITKTSSIYLLRSRGLLVVVERNLFNSTDINMFQIVEEKEAPMAVPSTCRNIAFENSKKLLVIFIAHKWVMRLRSKMRRSLCLNISL